jgi:hypothetical protein
VPTDETPRGVDRVSLVLQVLCGLALIALGILLHVGAVS